MRTGAVSEPARAGQDLERRAERAIRLGEESDVAKEPLRFAAELFQAMARAAGSLSAIHASSPLSGSLKRDAPRLERAVRSVFREAAARAPEPLGEEAAGRESEDRDLLDSRLLVYWEGGRRTEDDYLSRAALRPYLETLRMAGLFPDRIHRRGHCPACGAPPAISWRRDGSDMEGARRYLGCLLCGAEWPFERIVCASCFEADPRRLPSFSADRHPTVRIEACETCRRYIKSIDLSTDARPIPEVDDLVSLSMDLWAREEGWSRIEPGWAGL